MKILKLLIVFTFLTATNLYGEVQEKNIIETFSSSELHKTQWEVSAINLENVPFFIEDAIFHLISRNHSKQTIQEIKLLIDRIVEEIKNQYSHEFIKGSTFYDLAHGIIMQELISYITQQIENLAKKYGAHDIIAKNFAEKFNTEQWNTTKTYRLGEGESLFPFLFEEGIFTDLIGDRLAQKLSIIIFFDEQAAAKLAVVARIANPNSIFFQTIKIT